MLQNGSLCYLSALCHYKVHEYQEALTLLESSNWTGERGFSKPLPSVDDIVSLECSRQLLRAKIYEATDNQTAATECYQAALVSWYRLQPRSTIWLLW